jgi:hypothetical protein
MPDNRKPKMKLSLESESQDVSSASSVVSDRLLATYVRILDLPAKLVTFAVGTPADSAWMSLDRHGNGWDIMLHYTEDDSPVGRPIPELPIDKKAQAAKLMPELVSSLLDKLRENKKLLQEADSALDEVDRLLDEGVA